VRPLLVLLAALPLLAADPVIVLVGDSTVNDQGGWGPGFRASLPNATVVNLAQNGRSSKSFRDEGRWEPALTRHATHILIQFGHNDQPGKGPDRETDAATTYRVNLARYVDDARAAGAIPVLVTSIVRRNFTPEGKIVRDGLVPYVEAARAVAAEKNVPLIDLYNATLRQAESLGPDGCAEIDARDAKGERDHTHLGPKGREAIGAMAAAEFLKLFPNLRPR
jgi:lysophospholipase L1-like esterase